MVRVRLIAVNVDCYDLTVQDRAPSFTCSPGTTLVGGEFGGTWFKILSGLAPFLAVGAIEAIECWMRFCIPVLVMILERKVLLLLMFYLCY